MSGPAAFAVALTGTTIHASNVEQLGFIDGTLEFDPNSAAAQVARLYQAALGRAPDPTGLSYWPEQLQAGVPLDTLAAGFLGSPEFQARFGAPDNPGFVTQLYQNILGRAPDASGYASWINALDGGATRADVLVGFSESTENKAGTAPLLANGVWVPNPQTEEVARLYYTTLGRAPDAGGLASWTAALGHTLTLGQEADAFMASPEFQQKYGALDNMHFVDALYQNTLGRAPDAGGEAAWTQALATGNLSRAQVVLGFSDSMEHQVDTATLTGSHGVVLA